MHTFYLQCVGTSIHSGMSAWHKKRTTLKKLCRSSNFFVWSVELVIYLYTLQLCACPFALCFSETFVSEGLCANSILVHCIFPATVISPATITMSFTRVS